MEDDCKSVAQILCGECGEGFVHGVHFQKPISLLADYWIIISAGTDEVQFKYDVLLQITGTLESHYMGGHPSIAIRTAACRSS